MNAEPVVEWTSLDPGVIELDRATAFIAAGVVALVVVTAALVAWVVPGVPAPLRLLLLPASLALALVVGWAAYRWPAIAYRHAAYRVLPDRLEIRRGVVWRIVIAVPRSRVQHIDVSQGPFERRFDLATVTVYTAGTEFSRVLLRGLQHGLALAIRDGLLPRDTPDGV